MNKLLVRISFGFLSLMFGLILYGCVLSTLWLWFIVPVFQVHPLRVIEAAGIVTIVGFMTARGRRSEEDFFEGVLNNFIFSVLTSGFALLSGWILTLFL